MSSVDRRVREYERNAARLLRRAAVVFLSQDTSAALAIWSARQSPAGVWEGAEPAPAPGTVAGYAIARAERELCPGRPLEWWESRQRARADVAEQLRRVADMLDPPSAALRSAGGPAMRKRQVATLAAGKECR